MPLNRDGGVEISAVVSQHGGFLPMTQTLGRHQISAHCTGCIQVMYWVWVSGAVHGASWNLHLEASSDVTESIC